jgi:hypothetical protein
LEDKDASIRIKTLAAVENCRNEMIIDKVTALCFSEDISTKGTDELERMFRTVGKLAGGKVLDSIKQMIKKKIWFPFGKTQGKQNKLLAISALRHIPGTESLRLLEDLANDSDSLVRTKAQYMLRQLEETEGACEEEQPAVISEETD